MRNNRRSRKESGFTLIEVMVSMVILVVGVLSVADFFAQGLQASYQTQIQYIAQQKAQEAMETIFTARDTKILNWNQIGNTNNGNGGVFLTGAQPLCASGPDGLFGTSDDDTSTPDSITIAPGPDGIFGTADDKIVNLNPWMTRTIVITNLAPTNPNLSQVVITINWVYEGRQGQYILNSYISNYS
jgi:prepilin-type N-terminal cleavage/methylation domain-containing protein